MGGDHGPQVTVPAGISALRAHSNLQIIFVGQSETLKPLLNQHGSDLADRWEIQHATEVVGMDEPPSQALRRKKDSSMRVAIDCVKEGRAQAAVSAGNTGALMAISIFVLRTLPGISRPAIITRFPTCNEEQDVLLLDMGANVDSSAEHLCQFAIMGSILASAVGNVTRPRVGLLNIGEEEIKGNEQVKQTADLLTTNPLVNYIGYIEGNTIFNGNADVVVCDGFVGNITLKACEGIAKLIGQYAKEAFNKNIFTKLAAIPAFPVLKSLAARIDPRRRNGAIFIGLNGIVIKSHGHAGELAFCVAIEEAIAEVDKNIPERIRQELQELNHV